MAPKRKSGDDNDLDALMEALQGVYASQQAANPVALRDPERDAADVTWNAVVVGHPNKFDRMPEVFEVGKVLVSKLAARGALPAAATPYANVVLTAFLNFLWRSQNLMYLDPEMVAGQSRALSAAAAQLAADWAPPTAKPWFATLAPFPQAVDAALARLEACTWEDVYKHLDPEMNALQTQAGSILETIARAQPAVLPAATGFVMGTIIQKNTFSPLDGSVPEDFDNRLTRIYETLERDAEGRFMPWLAAGFQPSRTAPLDELDRWRADIGPESSKPKKRTS